MSATISPSPSPNTESLNLQESLQKTLQLYQDAIQSLELQIQENKDREEDHQELVHINDKNGAQYESDDQKSPNNFENEQIRQEKLSTIEETDEDEELSTIDGTDEDEELSTIDETDEDVFAVSVENQEEEQAQDENDEFDGDFENFVVPEEYKNICFRYRDSGYCPFGHNCNYKHPFRKECRDWNKTGKCKFGKWCKFLHKTKSSKKIPCVNMMKDGHCSFGGKCHFSHDLKQFTHFQKKFGNKNNKQPNNRQNYSNKFAKKKTFASNRRNQNNHAMNFNQFQQAQAYFKYKGEYMKQYYKQYQHEMAQYGYNYGAQYPNSY